MPHVERPQFAISLGGSLITPGCEINTPYLREFSSLLIHRIEKTHQISAIVTGGGPLARMYQEALRAFGVTDKRKLDAMGIYPTHENARLLTNILNAHDRHAAYVGSLRARRPDVSIWVTGGSKPGQTTDAVAVDWARILGYRQVINITNTPFVYKFGPDGITPDPDKPIYDMTHDAYLALVGLDHIPGENIPAGRTGILKAKKYGINFIVVGPDINNLQKTFEGKPFEGTTIHP